MSKPPDAGQTAWVSWIGSERQVANLSERDFVVTNEGREVPGVAWGPWNASAEKVVLLGHGGTVHIKADYIRMAAIGLAGSGIASIAIDGPGHGDRPGATGASAFTAERFASAWNSDGGTDGIVSDWRAALNFIEAEDGARPAGWWGLSMGTMVGIPVVANEPRISAAVLGLMGNWGPNASDLMRLAPQVTCPVHYLLQLDDEVVSPDSVRTLYEAIGSSQKSLHENAGSHAAVPITESLATLQFLSMHLENHA